MHEAVIVIADLYLQPGDRQQPLETEGAALAGLAHVARFGERAHLERGWRPWLSCWLGRADLADLAVAQVAAAVEATAASGPPPTRWIATPVQLIAGLTRLHLPRDGILRLSPGEQAALASAFERAFAATELKLRALSDGQLLLTTPRLAPIATTEPARCAGGEVQVPQGLAAAPLLRLTAEIEMWLHGEPLNEARRRRGAPTISGLWLWGAGGMSMPAVPARTAAAGSAVSGSVLAYGEDSWLRGLRRLDAADLRPIPEPAESLFTAPGIERAVAVVELAGAARAQEPWLLQATVAALDERLVRPALAALRAGALERLTLIANDTRISLGRLSALKRWRARRPALEAFA
jgi:hypothetical protein